MKRLMLIGMAWMVLSSLALAADSQGEQWLAAAKSGDEATRVQAIEVLGQQGDEIPGAMDLLVELVKDPSDKIQGHAAHALGQLGKAARPVAKHVAALVGDDNAHVRRAAIRALRKIDPDEAITLPIIIKILEDGDDEVRTDILLAIAEEGKAAVPRLTTALADPEGAYWACLVLQEMGPEAAGAVPALIKLIQSDDRPEVVREAMITLGQIGPAAAPAVPVLIEELKSPRPGVLVAAIFALGNIGAPAAQPAQDAIAKLADSDDMFIKMESNWALAKIDRANPDVLLHTTQILVDCLRSDDPQIRIAAARGLADLKPGPKLVLPELKKVMVGASPEVISNVVDAIASLGSEAVPPLIEALRQKEVRPKVAIILGRIGPEAKAAVPALVEALNDENTVTRQEVLFALASIGPEAKAAVPAIVGALQDPDMDVRYGACFALGKIGPAALEAKPELQKKLDSADQFLALSAAWALAQIDAACPQTAPKSVPLLIKALDSPELMVRLEAISALGCVGPLAKQAIDPLKKLATEDDEPQVREAAAKALEAIK